MTLNWKRLGYKTWEESLVQVLSFLKQNEKQIVSLGTSDELNIMLGDIILTLKGKAKKIDKELKNRTQKQLSDNFK